MNSQIATPISFGSLFRFFLQELKPRGPWLTPFNVISIPVIMVGLGLLVGFIAISMFLPLFDLTASAGGGAP